MKRVSSKRSASKKGRKTPLKKVVKEKPKKISPRKAYEYSDLADLVSETKERINCYAIVLDCSNSYYMKDINKYMCTLKLIDPSLHPGEKKKGQTFLRASMFALAEDDIPHIAKLGSILRIHRGDTRLYEKKAVLQINCDANIKSAWVLFDPTESTIPVVHTGRNFTFVNADKERLRKIREFSKKFFEKYGVDSMLFKDEAEKNKEVDFFGYVLSKKSKGASDLLTVFDGSKKVKVSVNAAKSNYVQPFDVVKIRGLAASKGKDQVLSGHEYTKVTRVSKEYRAHLEVMSKINENKSMKEEIDQMKPHVDKRQVISKPIKDGKLKVSALKTLFGGETVKGKKYRINASIIEIGPKDPKDCIKVVNPKTGKQYDLDHFFGPSSKETKIPEGYKYYLKMQFFVKDQSVPNDNNLYIIFLCTYDGKGAEFFKFPLGGRDKPTEKTLKEMKKTLQKLTRSWVSVDMIVDAIQVEGANPVFFVTDTQLTIQPRP